MFPSWSAPLCALLMLAACQSRPDRINSGAAGDAPPEKPAADGPTVAESSQQLAGRFLPIVGGVWLNADYLDRVGRTRSPRRALADMPGGAHAPTALLLNPAERQADTLQFLLGIDNHEGMTATLLFRPGLGTTTLPVRISTNEPGMSHTLRYQLLGQDTLLVLNSYTRRGKLLRTNTYRKAAIPRGKAPELDYGTQWMLRQRLFAGRYRGVDSLARPYSVRFDATGQVSGLPGARTYAVQYDFTGPYLNLDYLTLNAASKQPRQLTYRFHGDTLRLYRVQEDTSTFELRPGALRYTLIRQR
ncbi:hypothetical protein B0919_04575 [Hymenobacter sp. CRA2]|nr:hypothetical protein B0919_04575 [Hymenobacter sp. CRA2]